MLIVALILSSPRAQSADRKSGCNEHMVITCELTVSQLAPEWSLLPWTGWEALPACQWAWFPVNQLNTQGPLSHTHSGCHLHPEWAALRICECMCMWGWRWGLVRKGELLRGWTIVNPMHMPVLQPAALRRSLRKRSIFRHEIGRGQAWAMCMWICVYV